MPGALGNTAQEEVVLQEQSQSEQSLHHRHTGMKGRDGFLKSLHVLAQGMGPAPFLTLPHRAIVTAGLRAYLGGRGLVAAHISPGQQASPLQECQGSCSSAHVPGDAR